MAPEEEATNGDVLEAETVPAMPPAPAAPEALLSLATSEDTALQQKRTRTRPRCPSCGSDEVKTLGGGTHGKYRYSCQSCGAGWQQIPPHKLADNGAQESAEVALRKRPTTEEMSEPRQYKCGRCGQIKKGHVCSQQQQPPSKTSASAPAEATAGTSATVLSATAIPLGMQMPSVMQIPVMSQACVPGSQPASAPTAAEGVAPANPTGTATATPANRNASEANANPMYVLPYGMPRQGHPMGFPMACQYPVVSATASCAPGVTMASPRPQQAQVLGSQPQKLARKHNKRGGVPTATALATVTPMATAIPAAPVATAPVAK